MSVEYTVEVEVRMVRRATEKAIQVYVGNRLYWFPRSQIEDGEDIEAGDEDFTMCVTEWISTQKFEDDGNDSTGGQR